MKKSGPKKSVGEVSKLRGRRYAATVETRRTMVRSCDVDIVENDGAAIGNGGDGGGVDGSADS